MTRIYLGDLQVESISANSAAMVGQKNQPHGWRDVTKQSDGFGYIGEGNYVEHTVTILFDPDIIDTPRQGKETSGSTSPRPHNEHCDEG